MRESNVKINFLYNSAYQVLLILLPLITAPYISRVVGVEGIGTYSYTYSIAYYFLLLAMLGVNNNGSRCIARVRENREKLNETFSSIYRFQLITSVPVALLYFIYLTFFTDSNKLIAVLQLFYVLAAVIDINWLFFGLEKFKITVTRKIIIRIISVICIFIFVRKPADLWIYTLILSFGFFLGQSYLWLYAFKYVTMVKVPWKSAFGHFKPTFLLFIPIIATSIYRVLDKIMLGMFGSLSEVGLYDNAEKMMMVSLGVIAALGTVMLPKMSNLIANGRIAESKSYLAKSMKVAMFFACAIAFGLAAVAPEFAPIFYGKAFTASGKLMAVLSPTVLFISWANVIRTQYLIPNAKNSAYIISVIIGAIVNFLINLFLISSLGAMGTVIGTLCAEVSVAVYQTIVVRKDLDVRNYFKNTAIFFFAGLVMYCFLRFLANFMHQSLSLLAIELLVGAFVYMSITISYLMIIKDQLILGVLSKVRQRGTLIRSKLKGICHKLGLNL